MTTNIKTYQLYFLEPDLSETYRDVEAHSQAHANRQGKAIALRYHWRFVEAYPKYPITEKDREKALNDIDDRALVLEEGVKP